MKNFIETIMTKTSGFCCLFLIFSVSFAFTCCSAENGQKSTESAENEQIAAETVETGAAETCSIEEKKVDDNKDKPAVSPDLIWSEPSPGPMYYGYIQDYCKELREGGFSDWRPATPAEIKSTMKECKEFTELPNRNGDYSLDVALGNYWYIDGCFWGLRNDEESKKDDWNAYEIIIPKKCIVENWSPCNQCQWDTCNVFCVRNASPEDTVQKTEAETPEVDLKRLQWSKNTMFDQKNYSTSLLSLTHNRYTGWNCDYGCKMRLCPESFCSESELKKREEDAVPCGYDPMDCSTYEIFGVHDPYSYCGNLREGGFSDWRLPTLEELKALKVRKHEKNNIRENYAIFLSQNKTGKSGSWIFDPLQNRTLLINIFARHSSVSEVKRFAGDTNVICVRDKKENDRSIKPQKNPVKPLPDPKKLKWSDIAPKAMTWKEADSYCSDLEENDSSDWRLPNIDELRTLIQNCDLTEPGGSCRISENRQCLGEKCWSASCNGCYQNGTSMLKNKLAALEENLRKDYGDFWLFELEKMKNNGLIVEEYEKYKQLQEEYEQQETADFKESDFSKINSKEPFWSSTLDPENAGEAWGVDFISGKIGQMTMFIDVYDDMGSFRAPNSYDYKLRVICVR